VRCYVAFVAKVGFEHGCACPCGEKRWRLAGWDTPLCFLLLFNAVVRKASRQAALAGAQARWAWFKQAS